MNAKSDKTARSPFKLASLILCGLAGAAAAGAASAAASEGDVPAIAVKYDAKSLGSERAVRALYARIVIASQEVCPDLSVGQPWVGAAAAKCRKEAVARAVQQVNDPRLAALYVTRSKNG